MTPADLAQQQVWAAWVSAGAAVVQGLGAIAAIIAAVWIARSAEKRAAETERAALEREAAAEKAALEREAAAEAAAVARAEAAEARAEQRISDVEKARRGRIAELAVSSAEAALATLDREIAGVEANIGDNSVVHGGWSTPEAEAAREDIARLETRADDPNLVRRLRDLAVALAPYSSGRGLPWLDMAERLKGVRSSLEAAIARVREYESRVGGQNDSRPSEGILRDRS